MLARQAARRHCPDIRVNPEQWVLVWRAELSQWALDALVFGNLVIVDWDLLVFLAQDPNTSRVPLRELFLEGCPTHP